VTTITPAAAFTAEVSFAKLDTYISRLHQLRIGKEGRQVDFTKASGVARVFEEAAVHLAQAEAVFQGSWAAAVPLWTMPVLALDADDSVLHPLDWLNLVERKTCTESRAYHEWFLTLSEDGLMLTFEHGKFGYRRERHDRWSSAFCRLSELLAGTCSWHQFGDEDSRRTLLGKGQFYWKDLAAGQNRDIPVDNFVFLLNDGREFSLHGVGHRCALHYDWDKYNGAFEWYADYAEGLFRLADLLEGRLDLAEFGKNPDSDLYANVRVDLDALPPPYPCLAPLGKFVVRCIYAENDVLPAPELVYKTREGHQVLLSTQEGTWAVRRCDLHQQWTCVSFEQSSGAEALRCLARALQGLPLAPEA
jgi:hypothetical protein